MKTAQFHTGKLKPFAQMIALALEKNPALAKDPDLLWATLVINVPALGNKEHCPNCSASMQEYVFEFDLMDALLIFSMAQEVRRRSEKRSIEGRPMSFTMANQVKTTQLTCSYAARSRTTQCSKLGLVAKMRGENGKQVPGTWVITSRGWKALGGHPVPKSVKVWRGEIIERTEEVITISEALKSHEAKNKALTSRGRKVRSDYTDQFTGYEPSEWIHYSDLHQGALI